MFFKPIKIFSVDVNSYLDLILTHYMWCSGEWMASCFEIFNFLKNAKKTCKPNNRNLNRHWNILYNEQFTLHLAEGYSWPYQRSNIEIFSRIVNSFYFLVIFAKSSILDVWRGTFRTRLSRNHENKEIIYNTEKSHKNFKASYMSTQSLENSWKKSYYESNERNQMTYLQS